MSSSIEALNEKVEPLKAPIPGASATGVDASYEPEFEAVKAEIDKLTGMAGDLPNWSTVVMGAEELLTEKTKDIRLLCWYAVGKMQQNGLEGLMEGMVALHQVSKEHWDGLFPPKRRARARANQVGWFAEQAGAYVGGMTVGASDREPMKNLETVLSDTESYFSEALGDAFPGMGPLRSAIREKAREIPAEAPKKPDPPPAPAAAPAAAPPAAATPAPAAAAPAAAAAAPAAMSAAAAPTISGEQDVVPALKAVGKTIMEAAATLRRADPSKALAYRLQRVGAWLAVQGAPPAEAGKSKIPAPKTDQIKKLESLQSSEQWMPLLQECESLSGRYLFWLDLHRLSVMAMDRLGALFLDAKDAVNTEVAAFVARFPTVIDISFADGTPFVSAATKTWLEEVSASQGGGGGGASNAKLDEEEAEIAARFEEAKEMVSSGKIPEGLGLAIQLASRGADARARFKARLVVAKLALNGNKPDIAAPLFRALREECEQHQLDAWEPSLAIDVYSGLLSAIGPKAAGDAELFERLCRLDPAAAIKIGR